MVVSGTFSTKHTELHPSHACVNLNASGTDTSLLLMRECAVRCWSFLGPPLPPSRPRSPSIPMYLLCLLCLLQNEDPTLQITNKEISFRFAWTLATILETIWPFGRSQVINRSLGGQARINRCAPGGRALPGSRTYRSWGGVVDPLMLSWQG